MVILPLVDIRKISELPLVWQWIIGLVAIGTFALVAFGIIWIIIDHWRDRY